VRGLVAEGQADLGVAALPPDGAGDDLEEIPFCRDEVVVVVPPVHTWSEYEEIPLRSFLRTPMIMRDPQANSRRVVEATLASLGHKLAPALLEVGSTVAAKQAAQARRAPALLSAMAVKGNRKFKIRKVKNLRFSRSFAILCASTESLIPTARVLLEHLQERGTAMD
jgi:DNA-binding transcriptional LysR family regulator